MGAFFVHILVKEFDFSLQSNTNSDYINAVFVDGFKTEREFIVTEWPFSHTAANFWFVSVLIQSHCCQFLVCFIFISVTLLPIFGLFQSHCCQFLVSFHFISVTLLPIFGLFHFCFSHTAANFWFISFLFQSHCCQFLVCFSHTAPLLCAGELYVKGAVVVIWRSACSPSSLTI